MDNTIAKIVTNVVQELGVGIAYYIMSSNSPKYKHLVNRGISMGYQLVHLESDFNALYNRDTCYIFIPSDFVMQGDCKRLFEGSYFARLGGLNKIKGIDLTGVKTDFLTDLSFLFAYSLSLEYVIFPDSFCIEHVNNLRGMFTNCKRLKRISFPKFFNTHEVCDMCIMFLGCIAIEEIVLPNGFSLESLKSANHMFSGCMNLKRLVIPKDFSLDKVNNHGTMFEDCISLRNLDFEDGCTEEQKMNWLSSFRGW